MRVGAEREVSIECTGAPNPGAIYTEVRDRIAQDPGSFPIDIVNGCAFYDGKNCTMTLPVIPCPFRNSDEHWEEWKKRYVALQNKKLDK